MSQFLWANAQLLDFCKDPIFKEALESLEKKRIEEFYFFTEKEPTNEDLDRLHNLWKDLWAITAKYVEKNKDKLFEYEFSYDFYYKHLAANIVVYYFLKNCYKEGELTDYIIKKIMEEGYFSRPDDKVPKMRDSLLHKSLQPLFPLPGMRNYYLAIKWFFNEKTEKYYSEGLLKEIAEYEAQLKNAIDPKWREKIEKENRKVIRVKIKMEEERRRFLKKDPKTRRELERQDKQIEEIVKGMEKEKKEAKGGSIS
ncbi:hypothetical protein A3K73_03200 [Candidatus Pacearchaeota archaeon RBG_13_36_9]|nr:MAG: hypothetical protein A3K73_03200 [Candidatus Pacearchaeota archaeon RBG_13_36_9]